MIADILKKWADSCRTPWYLYRETLLCANGLEEFPPALDCAQIAISADALPNIAPPDGWTKIESSSQLHFEQDGRTVLTVDILPDSPEAQTILCSGVPYPVRPDYREYLEEHYGDYENGLTDDIGVGLTTEEKVSLKLHQKKCREALAFVQELSQKHGLRYYLIAGSVLGAVRHQGFIPWDDDVDLGIRVEDLEKFETAVRENLPAGFTLEQCAPNHPYPRMFSKICYDGRCCLDLWPLVPTYPDGWKAKFTWFFGKIITKVHYCKIGYPVPKHGKAAKIISLFLPDTLVMKLARWNERKDAGAPCYINLYSVYSRQKEAIPRKWLDTPATAVFEGIQVPVVGCTHDYLTHLYGNYMTLPAPWKRASRHFERFHTAMK